MELDEAREIITSLDDRIVELFVERMRASSEAAKYKYSRGMAIYDPVRESAVLERAASLAGEEMADYARSLYEKIIALSRDYQKSLMDAWRREAGQT